jgi:hypothetical protein
VASQSRRTSKAKRRATRPFTIWFPEADLAALRALRAEVGTPLSVAVRRAVAAYLKQHRTQATASPVTPDPLS